MRERVCKNCGGRTYKVVGQNMVKCMFCGTLYVDEYASKEEEFLTVGAYEKLRECKFEQAKEEFEKILSLYPLSFEAYYGKVLAKNKIVFYSNHKGSSKQPRFFGDEIPSIQKDEDFLNAIKNAPQEIAKSYTDQAKRIEKIREEYLADTETQFDVIVCATNYNKEKDTTINQMLQNLGDAQFKTYFVQGEKEKEEKTFKALQTSKVFVLFVKEAKELSFGEIKNIYDRYLYFISQRKKTKSSFIVVVDPQKIEKGDLPKEIEEYRSSFDINESTFLNDIQIKIENESKNFVGETAKIDTVKIEKVNLQKKEYLDTERITPTDLGHYHVENIPLNDENKIRWIFLTLKNGDFETAKELIDKGLEKDPNNAELLFAELLFENKIKTQEEFFSSIGNFKDKEKIDKILKYSSKNFAEFFIDGWEKLIEKLDSEEYYNAFLLYLAQFNSPNRDNFIAKAESKAVETLNDELIEKVIKCYKSDEVDRFVDFYFMLAQKSDDQKYYEKILEIDKGHEQSNIAMLLQHFKTNEEKLTYRNKEEIEEVFQYLSDSTRAQFVSAVVDMILPISFYDIEKAEKQLDFYLSYLSNEKMLCNILIKIAQYFQSEGFFKQAEKYIVIAISKDKNNAQLYWNLIQIKAHCKNDTELILSKVKITQMPEWGTLLNLADEKSAEKYAEISSKINLYNGEKQQFASDTPDKVYILNKLNEFINRNRNILTEIEKQEGTKVLKGVEYYSLQLQPFEKYVKEIESEENFEDYKNIINKINDRLDALQLTLDSSINTVDLLNKEEGLKVVLKSKSEQTKTYIKRVKDIKKDKFLKRFLYLFLELFPILFTTLLLLVALVDPKEVYLYFSETFLVVVIVLTTTIGMVNLAYFVNKKDRLTKGWKISNLALIVLVGINLVLMFCGMYLFPKNIEINNAKEFKTLISNAPSANYVLVDDIDMEGTTWRSTKFNGELNGNGHSILNLKLKQGSNIGLFTRNSGEIKNLTIVFANETYSNVSHFGGIAVSNYGLIENCSVNGDINLQITENGRVGGIVSLLSCGEVIGNQTRLNIVLNLGESNLDFGAVIGEVVEEKKEITVTQNESYGNISINSNNGSTINAGGIIGILNHSNVSLLAISKNASNVNFTLSGKAESYAVGGLVGDGQNGLTNSYSTGKIDVSGLLGQGFVGGLYGVYDNGILADAVEKCYSVVEVVEGDQSKSGSLVGKLFGTFNSCFTNSTKELEGSRNQSGYARLVNCGSLNSGEFYNSKYDFDENIWNINENSYPTLK